MLFTLTLLIMAGAVFCLWDWRLSQLFQSVDWDGLLADERPFIPLWFGRTLHVQSPTVDHIDYPSSSFSNENIWAWRMKAA